jgi:hypothetical protein
MRIMSSGSIEGRPVEAGQMLAQLGAVDEAINAAQQVIGRNMVLKPERVEQALLHHETLAHHARSSCRECLIRES